MSVSPTVHNKQCNIQAVTIITNHRSFTTGINCNFYSTGQFLQLFQVKASPQKWLFGNITAAGLFTGCKPFLSLNNRIYVFTYYYLLMQKHSTHCSESTITTLVVKLNVLKLLVNREILLHKHHILWPYHGYFDWPVFSQETFRGSWGNYNSQTHQDRCLLYTSPSPRD